jgi:hypothetical protein
VRVEILPGARDDLLAGFWFYERQGRGLGAYFRGSLNSDIESLSQLGGVHSAVFGYHRVEQALPICDLLPHRGRCSSNPRDSGLPQKALVDSPKASRRIAGN